MDCIFFGLVQSRYFSRVMISINKPVHHDRLTGRPDLERSAAAEDRERVGSGREGDRQSLFRVYTVDDLQTRVLELMVTEGRVVFATMDRTG